MRVRLLSRKLTSTAAMELGDTVIHHGRRYVLRGLDPMSVADGCAHLEELESGEATAVPLAELEPLPPVSAEIP
jgi:hypothetical protein